MYQRGEFIGRRVSNRDVTGRMRLEVQLRQAQKMEAIGNLSGGIAHDFNNILTAIIGYGTLLQMKLRAGDPLREMAEQILLAAEKAALLTSGLLAFSRKQVLNPRPIALNAVVRAVEKLLARIIGEDVALKLSLQDEELTVLADPVQIDQVLMNLATNARDAMPGGGTLSIATTRITIGPGVSGWESESIGPGDYALLTVQDTGCGMDEATRAKIFEPFFTTKEPGRGTGLGLAIVYGIVSQHRGAIRVDSEPGRGTTFRICLPLVGPAAAPAAATSAPLPRGTETILLVEDDAAVRALLKATLQEFGYAVLEAADGVEACERFDAERERIDLVLTDVIMPRMNGRDALEAMRKTRPCIRCLFMSGYTADAVRARGPGDAEARFIAKPVTPPALLIAVREILDAPPPA
jgi:nitrogen-specific signal transduction histidine kinase